MTPCLGAEKKYEIVIYKNAQPFCDYHNRVESNVTKNCFDEGISSIRFPLSIDLVSYGSGVVIGFHLRDCYEYAGNFYRPSECGSEEILVIYLDGISSFHDEVEKEEALGVDAIMFVGSRYGPGQGCIGYPESLSIKSENIFDEEFEFNLEAKFMFHRYEMPEITCGERRIEGHFKSKIIDIDDDLNPAIFNIFK